jgi:hypothetical protein
VPEPPLPPPPPALAAPVAPEAAPALGALDEALATWPPRPRLAARQMALRYGPPSEITEDAVVWRDAGLFTRITVHRREVPHDFPRPHVDFLEQTVAFRVPAGKFDELLAFDGSLTIERTTGELSSRCDSERRNVLALNLAHDLVTGATTADAAREAFAQNHLDDVLGLSPAYATALRFEPAEGAADPDVPIIPGSPVRPSAPADAPPDDVGEVLGFLVALDDREVTAALEVEGRFDVDPAVRAYATMLHGEHGRELVDTLALGETIGVRPTETQAVDAFRQDGAGAPPRIGQR